MTTPVPHNRHYATRTFIKRTTSILLISSLIISISTVRTTNATTTIHITNRLSSPAAAATQRRKTPPPFLLSRHLRKQHRLHDLPTPFLTTLRGGSSEEYDAESSDFDDVTDLDDEFATGGSDDDFSEESSLERALDLWNKTPPFTKSYLALCTTATAWGYFSNKNVFPPYLMLEWKPTFFKGQLWRPFTAFLNLGAFNIGYLMTMHFVWTYMSILERMSHDAPYDFWCMFAFAGVSMVCGYGLLGISPQYLGHNVSTFLVYVWSRYHEGLEVNMMELFNTRAEMLPWFFLAQTALLEGEFPVLDLLGILFGHIYYHCKTTNILKTPKAIIDWYHSDGTYSTMIRNKYKAISSDFEMQ